MSEIEKLLDQHGKAIKEAVFLDLIKVIPVALIWAIVWFILLIIRVLTSKKKGRSCPRHFFAKVVQ